MENLLNYLSQNSGTLSSISWYPELGTSWGYYINSGDYKLEYVDNNICLSILVAGIDKDDIDASIEGKIIKVTTSKPGWNGNVAVEVDLTGYKVDTTDPSVRLANGVLQIMFPIIDEKRKLEIK